MLESMGSILLFHKYLHSCQKFDQLNHQEYVFVNQGSTVCTILASNKLRARFSKPSETRCSYVAKAATDCLGCCDWPGTYVQERGFMFQFLDINYLINHFNILDLNIVPAVYNSNFLTHSLLIVALTLPRPKFAAYYVNSLVKNIF